MWMKAKEYFTIKRAYREKANGILIFWPFPVYEAFKAGGALISFFELIFSENIPVMSLFGSSLSFLFDVRLIFVQDHNIDFLDIDTKMVTFYFLGNVLYAVANLSWYLSVFLEKEAYDMTYFFFLTPILTVSSLLFQVDFIATSLPDFLKRLSQKSDMEEEGVHGIELQDIGDAPEAFANISPINRDIANADAIINHMTILNTSIFEGNNSDSDNSQHPNNFAIYFEKKEPEPKVAYTTQAYNMSTTATSSIGSYLKTETKGAEIKEDENTYDIEDSDNLLALDDI